jgi:hypothetical protein
VSAYMAMRMFARAPACACARLACAVLLVAGWRWAGAVSLTGLAWNYVDRRTRAGGLRVWPVQACVALFFSCLSFFWECLALLWLPLVPSRRGRGLCAGLPPTEL